MCKHIELQISESTSPLVLLFAIVCKSRYYTIHTAVEALTDERDEIAKKKPCKNNVRQQ